MTNMANVKCFSFILILFFIDNFSMINTSVKLSSNSLGLSVLKKIFKHKDETRNIGVSPLSISLTLTLLFHGSKGETRDELIDIFNFNHVDEDEVKKEWKSIFQNIIDKNGPKKSFDISLANGLFTSDKHQLIEDYTQLLKTIYESKCEKMDFSDPDNLNVINNWIKDKTNNKINHFFKKLNPNSVLILVNALYFKGKWEKAFDLKSTKNEIFKNFGTTDALVPTMYMSKQKYNYTSDEKLGFEILAVPYSQRDLDLYIILPKTGDKKDINELLEKMNFNKLEKILKTMKETDCELWLPRFKSESMFTLNNYLKSLGIEKIFSNTADLSAISKEKGLSVSQFSHQSVVEVNEEGTVAAAATGAEVVYLTTIDFDSVDFKVNRPFIYFIRHKSGLILFIGIINEIK